MSQTDHDYDLEQFEPTLANILLSHLELEQQRSCWRRLLLDGFEDLELWERFEHIRRPVEAIAWTVHVRAADDAPGSRSMGLRYAMCSAAIDACGKLPDQNSVVRIVAERHLRLDLDMVVSGRVPLASERTVFLSSSGRVEDIDDA